ncbi:MAG: flagellar protein FlgN [Pseudomonadota bacterium]
MQRLFMADLLRREIQYVTRLADVLQREYQALQGRDAAQVEHCTAEKQNLCAHIEELGQQRTTLLSGMGYASSAAGVGAYLRTHAEENRLWQELLHLTAQCRRQNQINGSLVNAGRSHTRRILSILRGQPSDGELYGPAGDARRADDSQALATA